MPSLPAAETTAALLNAGVLVGCCHCLRDSVPVAVTEEAGEGAVGSLLQGAHSCWVTDGGRR